MRCTTKISAPTAGFHIYTTKFSAPAAGLSIYITKNSAHTAGFHIYTSNTTKISTPAAGLYTYAIKISGLISNSFLFKKKGWNNPPILREIFGFHGGFFYLAIRCGT